MSRGVLYRDEVWMEQGLCRQTDPDLWFSPLWPDQRRAAAICARCAVNAQCDEWAERVGDINSGICAGLSQRQRQRIKAGLPVRGRRRPEKV